MATKVRKTLIRNSKYPKNLIKPHMSTSRDLCAQQIFCDRLQNFRDYNLHLKEAKILRNIAKSARLMSTLKNFFLR